MVVKIEVTTDIQAEGVVNGVKKKIEIPEAKVRYTAKPWVSSQT